MEALEFLKEYRRMCNLYEHCEGCPLSEKQCLAQRLQTDSEYLTVTSEVEKWSKEHPIITNAQKFKEVFGFNGDTVNKFKPEIGIAGTKGSCGYDDCRESCGSRHFPRCPMWWNDEFKEPEHENE